MTLQAQTSLCRGRNTKLEGRAVFKANPLGVSVTTMSKNGHFFPKTMSSCKKNKGVKYHSMITGLKAKESNI